MGTKVENIEKFFAELTQETQSNADLKIAEKAKELGISKRSLNNDFKAYINAKNSEERAKKHKESVDHFNKLFGVQGISVPANFYVSNDGYISTEDMKICRVFTILKKIQTNKTQYYEIAGLTENRTVDVRDLLKSDRLAVEFGTKGEYLDANRVKALSQYIATFLIDNEAKIETIRGADRTGWNEAGDFDIPNRGGCLFIDEDLQKRFTYKGSLDGEIELLRNLAKGKVFLLSLFALSSTFYGIFDIPINFIAHVGGQTGEGKSFAIKSAMALFGEKDLPRCGKNWNATLNGLETYWERCHSLPSWVDEMESAKTINEVVSSLYVFSEGTGKSRAYSRDGEVSERAVKSFKGVLFTSGEKNLADIIKKTGETKNKPLGIVRRSLDLSSVSLWDGVNKKLVGEAIDRNHGNFIDHWVKTLKKVGFDRVESRFWEIMQKQNISLDGKEYLFAMLETTLHLLRALSIINDEDLRRQEEFIKEEIKIAHIQMNDVKNDYVNFLDDLNDFLGERRTQIKGLCEEDEIRGGVIGKFESEILFINNKSIEEICSKYGYVWKQIRAKLHERKILLSLETKKQKFLLTPMRCFMFNMRAVEAVFDEKTNGGKVIPVEFRREDGTLKVKTMIQTPEEDIDPNDIPF